jgi:tripartite-type tricarboxylate transporter receptor subunit TctC
MIRETKGNIMSIAIFVILILLFQMTNLAYAKDPNYPTKPINFYIAFGAGGTTDLVTRAFGEAASKHMGQPFIYINRGGAGGTLTSIAVMNAKPDGYTLGTTSPSQIFVAPFSDEAPYKDLSRFTMIMNFGNYVYPMMVRSDSPWKTWNDFIQWAKNNPRAAKVGGIGAKSVSTQGFAIWQVEQKAQVEVTFVPFPGGAEQLSALLGGHVTISSSGLNASNMPYIMEGKLRILAFLGTQKAPGYEHIPTLEELYHIIPPPDLMGVFGPKGLPDYVLRKLDDVFAKAVKEPDFVNFMARMYTPIVYMNRKQKEQYIEKRYQKVGEIMKMLKAEEKKDK